MREAKKGYRKGRTFYSLIPWSVAVAGAMLLGGCAPKVHQSSVSTVEQMPERAFIVSGAPARDSIAFEASQQQLKSADHALLERLGPEVPSERLERARREAGLDGSSPDAANEPAAVPPGVTVLDLPDDHVRIVYPLRNYGGATVTSARDGGTARRNVTAKAPDLAPLVSVVQAHAGGGAAVIPLPNENTLIITAARDMVPAIMQLMRELDVAPRQVEITARIFEVTQDFDFQQGAQILFNRIAANDSQSASSVFHTRRALDSAAGAADVPFQGSMVQFMRTFEDAGISLEGAFQLLAEEGLIRIVSSPRMTVGLGQTGYMLAGQELPIQAANIVNNNLHLSTSYKPVGVQLYITPQAVGPESVKLHVITAVSTIAGFAPMPTLAGNHGSQLLINPIIDSREAETAVTINHNNTLVISGLRMARTITRENKVPILGDLPLLGWLFKNHRSQQQFTDLYFFLTPALL